MLSFPVSTFDFQIRTYMFYWLFRSVFDRYQRIFTRLTICSKVIFPFACNTKSLQLPLLRLRVMQKPLQLPLFSFFFSSANQDGLTKAACRIFRIC